MIDVLDESTINNVISIVNNIVYQGSNQTTQEIDSNLKNKLKTYFVDFFGEQHKDKISQRIDAMDINRCFHVLGSRNSISQFLLDEKARIFNEGKKHQLTNPETLEYFATTPIADIVEDAKNNSRSAFRLKEICDYLGFRPENLSTPNGQVTFQSLIQNTYQSFQSTPYSKNPEQNQQMMFLEQYIGAYKQHIQGQLQMMGLSLNDYLDNPQLISAEDPVFRKLTENMPDYRAGWCAEDFFLPTSGTEAFQMAGDIYLGINPNSSVIIHETFHRVVFNENTQKSGIRYEEGQRYFNEVVTEFYSQMIHSKFLAVEGADLTINSEKFESSYEYYLFKHMKPFMKTFSPEFKEVLMRENPIADMKRIIGERQFDSIADCCDTIFRLGHDANSNQILTKIKSFMTGVELGATTFLSREKKSPIERVFNAISRNAEVVANHINATESPHLNRLANGIYAMTDYINQHTQGKVSDKLGADISTTPTMNWNPQNPNPMESELSDDNEMVMEKKNYT